jgi:hypothetical protein
MFIGMMAIMAAGTETLVEALRLPLGIKRNTSAMEAFKKLGSELPGKLAALGVDTGSLKAFEDECARVRQTVEDLHNQAGEILTVYDHLKRGELVAAYKALKQISVLPGAGGQVDAQVAKGRKTAKDAIGLCLIKLQERLPVKIPDSVQKEIDLSLDQVTPQTALSTFEGVVKVVENAVINEGSTEDWLRTSVDGYLTEADDVVDEGLDLVAEALKELGFRDAFADGLTAPLRKGLDAAQEVARDKAKTYAQALENLLEGVRDLRKATPVWLRRTGRIGGPVVAGVTILTGVVLTVVSVAGARCENPIPFSVAFPAIYGLLIAGLGSTVGALWAYAGVMETSAQENPKVTTLTVAQVILQQEAQHKREEAFRVSVLKLISLVTGVVLAYLLQIDALVLLKGIIPAKTVATINAVVIPTWPLGEEASTHPALTVGIILTGLAATAGSAFWHDQLDKLQSAKRQAEAGAKTVQQISGMVVTPEE